MLEYWLFRNVLILKNSQENTVFIYQPQPNQSFSEILDANGLFSEKKFEYELE